MFHVSITITKSSPTIIVIKRPFNADNAESKLGVVIISRDTTAADTSAMATKSAPISHKSVVQCAQILQLWLYLICSQVVARLVKTGICYNKIVVSGALLHKCSLLAK